MIRDLNENLCFYFDNFEVYNFETPLNRVPVNTALEYALFWNLQLNE